MQEVNGHTFVALAGKWVQLFRITDIVNYLQFPEEADVLDAAKRFDSLNSPVRQYWIEKFF